MNYVDLAIIILAITYALSGYRNGAITGALSIGGFISGVIVGAQLARPIATHFFQGQAQVAAAVLVVGLAAILGQVLGSVLARTVRRQITWRPARHADAALGSVLSVVGVLIVTWMVALPLASAPYPSVARQVRESRVVHAVDAVMPGQARQAYASLRQVVDRTGFPQVFGALSPSRILGVNSPDPALAGSAVVAQTRASVLKVLSSDGSCGHDLEGSGFVFARGRVMTNAHVVAGMRTVRVQTTAGTLSAAVVVFDPQRDVAVLSVPGLTATPLSFASVVASSAQDAIVLGYPQDGPFDVEPARVRDRETAFGQDIYGHKGVSRDIYAIRALVRPGNSGGPLISTSGTVLGVVFAAATDSADTGYVLTAAEVADAARTGAAASASVSTQSCA